MVAALAWILFCGLASAAPSGNSRTLSCHLKAHISSDNDMRLAADGRPPGESVEVPSPVRSKIENIAAEMMARIELSPEWFKCGELYPSLFRISVSGGLYLYVADISLGSGVEYFLLIVHEPATGAITGNPPRIHATSTQAFGWKDALLTRPMVSVTSLINRRMIVFEERVHNGTVYNAVIYNYFEIGPALALTRVLTFESRAIGIGKQEGTIRRDLKPSGAKDLRLDTWLEPANQPGQRVELGYAILESPGPGTPFHVKQRHPRDRDSSAILVTYCGPDTPNDDAFLSNGPAFNY